MSDKYNGGARDGETPNVKRDISVPDWAEDREFRVERLHVHERCGDTSQYVYTVMDFTIQEAGEPKTTVASDLTVDLDKMR